MMFLPLIGTAPVTYSARVLRAVRTALRRSLRDWRAHQRERFYFGSLNEYEVERLAKDIGLSRSEVFGDRLHPTRRSLGPPLPAWRDRLRAARAARLIRPTDV